MEAELQERDRAFHQLKSEYLPYCDRFYFAMEFAADDAQVGVLELVRQSLEVRNGDRLVHCCEEREEVCLRVNRVVYGF